MPDDFMVDWAARVTMVVTYDPNTEELAVDRGALPRLFADAILRNLEDGAFRYTDEVFDAPAAADTED